jgi:transcriptional regulator with XRE-family HTH domain
VSDDLKIAFAKTLKTLRKKSGMSQQELADYCDLERVYISKLERGVSMPSIETIFKLADVLKLRPFELVQFLEKQLKSKNSSTL